MLKNVFVIAILLSATPLFAGKTTEVVRQARDLALKKDRIAAAQLLQQAIGKEKSARQQKEMQAELNRLTTLFFTNEGQRIFELAESVRFSGQTGYLSKYEDAAKLEGPHFSIQKALAYGYLQAKNCKKAAESAEGALLLNPYSPDVQLLKLRAAYCLAPQEVVEQAVEQIHPNERVAERKTFLAQMAYVATHDASAAGKIVEALKDDANYPSAYYWRWKIHVREETGGQEEAEKFVSLCKAATAETRRKYDADPDLCHDLESVQDYLKKLESRSI